MRHFWKGVALSTSSSHIVDGSDVELVWGTAVGFTTRSYAVCTSANIYGQNILRVSVHDLSRTANRSTPYAYITRSNTPYKEFLSFMSPLHALS